MLKTNRHAIRTYTSETRGMQFGCSLPNTTVFCWDITTTFNQDEFSFEKQLGTYNLQYP
jgi:hypothetical protein